MSVMYDNLKLHKGMYNEAGRSFTQVLESRDPSEQYQGSALEGMDAFQRQLKRFDIKVKGRGSDMVEKFFQTSESAVLFPEFVSRAVRQGMEEVVILPSIVAATTQIEGMDYRSIVAVPEKKDKQLRLVAEGAQIPETSIRVKDELTRLYKRGRMLVSSYEAIRFQRIDLFSVTLRQIGAHIARSQLEDALDVLLDAKTENRYSFADLGGATALDYNTLVHFWAKFEPYEMNTLLVSSDIMLEVLKIDEFKDATAGMNFQGTGALQSPMGATLIRCSALPEGTLIGMDKSYALEMVQASEVTVEYDRLIDRQLERAAISCIAGFSKLYEDAAKILTRA